MRNIKFRAWNGKWMVDSAFGDWISFDGVPYTEASSKYETPHIEIEKVKGYELMQFTGLKDKNDKEIYESDIFRVEENDCEICDQCDGCGWYEGGETIKTTCEHCNGTGNIDGVDFIYYLVIVWIKEWCMFGTLRVADEYFNYINDGIKALDEPMFWTYTLEDTNDRKFFLCGNIYQNPELVEKVTS